LRPPPISSPFPYTTLFRSAPLFSRVYRWERGNAQHEVGHLARMAAIDRALAKHPGLFITGSGFRGVGIPDCIADGRKTAKQVDRSEEHTSELQSRVDLVCR